MSTSQSDGVPTVAKPAPLEIVRSVYAAFARGDIPRLLGALHPDVEWRINVDLTAPGAAGVPTFRPRRGVHDVGAFFALLGSAVEFHAFQPRSFLMGEDEVAVLIAMEFTIVSTQRRCRTEAMHHWTLDRRGRITRFVDFFDTLADAAAWGQIRSA